MLESFWVGEPMEVALKGGTAALRPFPHFAYASLPSRCSSVSFIISFHRKFINNTETVFLSSVSLYSKLIEYREGVVATSNLYPVDAQLTNLNLHLVSEGG